MSYPRRVLLRLLAVVVVPAMALAAPAGPPAGAQQSPSAEVACSIPHDWLLRAWRGWREDRGGELQVLAQFPNYVGSGLPHVGPWPYVQRVPMLWYGPGFIKPAGVIKRPVTVADIAATQAELLGFDFVSPEGTPMTEALLPAAERPDPPKLVVTLIWDAGGRNVLAEHPDAWPFTKSLIRDGAWYDDATVGSSPTSTAQIHATIGTGAFPNEHSLVGHHIQIGREIVDPYPRGQGPNLLMLPTLADLYDRAMGNEPKVGLLGTVPIHLGMLGHGAMWGGGDRDIAVMRAKTDAEKLGEEGFEWNLPEHLSPYYEFPAYTRKVPGFEQDVEAIDQADGKRDGKWRDNPIEPLLQGFDTPARTPFQDRVVETMMQREGFGADDVPDLMFINYKEIDYISHVWTMNSLEMKDAVVAQDEALKNMVEFLNKEVGENQWVLLVTADHGAIPDPKVSGAWQINTGSVSASLSAKFDSDGDDLPIIQGFFQTNIFINVDEVADNGYTLDDLAQHVMTLTKGQTAAEGVAVPQSQQNQKVFQAAYPSEVMNDLECLPEARGD